MYNVIIIGAGPGGFACAEKLIKEGKSVAIIEKEFIGGTCLNNGCIPTKAYIKSAKIISSIEESSKFGISIEKFALNFEEIYNRKEQIISKLRNAMQLAIKQKKIDLYYGNAKLKSNNEILVESIDENKNLVLECENIVIATGSKTLKLPIFDFNSKNILTSKELLNIKTLPKEIAIIGGGVIGCEFAYILSKFGCSVTIIDIAKSLIPLEDEDISKELMKIFKKQKIKMNLGKTVKKVIEYEGKVKITFDDDNEMLFEKSLVAIGRISNIEILKTSKLEIETKNKMIVVDDKYQTNIKNIYAIGDVINNVKLAHLASFQGEIVAEVISGKNKKTYNSITACIYTNPEIATVGLREKELKLKNIDYEIKKFNFRSNSKAFLEQEIFGFVKLILSSENQLIGAAIIGPHASDLIHELSLAISNEMSIESIEKTIHAHPSFAEIIYECASKHNN